MTKLTIGNATFRALEYPRETWLLETMNPGLEKQVRAKDLALKMQWDCKEKERTPEPYPTKFPKVTSSFLVYRVPDSLNPDPMDIQRATQVATRQIIALTGLSPEDFVAELRTKLGSYDPTFDVDAAIKSLKPTKRMKIRVRLVYRHFNLLHNRLAGFTAAIVSLPDRVRIEYKETHRCTEEGVIAVKRYGNRYVLASETYVRATTEDAYRLRSKGHKDQKKTKNKLRLIIQREAFQRYSGV